MESCKGGDAVIVFDLGKSDNQIIAVDLLGSANVAERSEKISSSKVKVLAVECYCI